MNRRTFLKALVVAPLAAPAIAALTRAEPPLYIDGQRVGSLTHVEVNCPLSGVLSVNVGCRVPDPVILERIALCRRAEMAILSSV